VTTDAPNLRDHREGTKVRRASIWVAFVLVAAAACGPFTTPDGAEDEGATTTTSPGDAGTAQPEVPRSDAGTSANNRGAPDAGAPANNRGTPDAGAPHVFAAHDLKVEGVDADVLFAHRIKAKEIRCNELVMIADSDLPDPGEEDVKGGVISATELHVHDVEADWVHAGTLYVRKLEAK
jgi:hypothetical protein